MAVKAMYGSQTCQKGDKRLQGTDQAQAYPEGNALRENYVP